METSSVSKQLWDLMTLIFLRLFITYLCIQVCVEDVIWHVCIIIQGWCGNPLILVLITDIVSTELQNVRAGRDQGGHLLHSVNPVILQIQKVSSEEENVLSEVIVTQVTKSEQELEPRFTYCFFRDTRLSQGNLVKFYQRKSGWWLDWDVCIWAHWFPTLTLQEWNVKTLVGELLLIPSVVR